MHQAVSVTTLLVQATHQHGALLWFPEQFAFIKQQLRRWLSRAFKGNCSPLPLRALRQAQSIQAKSPHVHIHEEAFLSLIG